MLIDLAISALIVAAGFFGLVGSYGLVKLPDLPTRLHAPTKATTLGVGGVLVASMAYFAARGEWSAHELLISLFLFLTAPITAKMIAKAYLHAHMKAEDLPRTGRRYGWANFDPPPEDPDPHGGVPKKR